MAIHKYDAAHAMVRAHWGALGSIAAMFFAISAGFYIPQRFHQIEGAIGSGFNGMVMIVGGPLNFVLIPSVAGFVVWAVILSRATLAATLNLLALQTVNVGISRDGDMTLLAWSVVACAVFFDALIIKYRKQA